MRELTTIGIDLAKNVFAVHAVDRDGRVVLRRLVGRGKLAELIAQTMIIDPFGNVVTECRLLGSDIAIATCAYEKIARSCGHRYREARKPELYRHILGAEHCSEQNVAWMSGPAHNSTSCVTRDPAPDRLAEFESAARRIAGLRGGGDGRYVYPGLGMAPATALRAMPGAAKKSAPKGRREGYPREETRYRKTRGNPGTQKSYFRLR
jgi:hypothetical protein